MTRRVAICALTLRRPDGLRELLEGLSRLEEPPPDVAVRVVIVENDEAGASRDLVEGFQQRLRWPIEYAIEPQRGIPFARNRALAVAAPADFVVFIDDDEIPEPPWLSELLRVQEETGADVVLGPVIPIYPEGTPAWIVDGGFFYRKRFPTGHRVTFGRTSNVLLGTHIVPDIPAPFNESFGLTGGDDTHFFERARLEDRLMVWADEAIVTEVVPTTRMTVRWLLEREYRRGNTISLCLRDLNDSWPRRARRVAHGLLRIAQGAGGAAAGAVRGRAHLVAGLRRVCFGAGLLTGLFGVRFEEYRQIHGS